MPIVTSRAGLMIDTIVAKLQASAVFADPVQVYDGPAAGGGTTWMQAVFIGFDGNWHVDGRGDVAPGTQYSGVLINQERPYIGNTTAREQLEIPCCAEAWSGDPLLKTTRDQALAMLGGVETVLRTDPTLGIDGSTDATLTVGDLFYEYDAAGNVNMHIPFTIHVTTQLTTS